MLDLIKFFANVSHFRHQLSLSYKHRFNGNYRYSLSSISTISRKVPPWQRSLLYGNRQGNQWLPLQHRRKWKMHQTRKLRQSQRHGPHQLRAGLRDWGEVRKTMKQFYLALAYWSACSLAVPHTAHAVPLERHRGTNHCDYREYNGNVIKVPIGECYYPPCNFEGNKGGDCMPIRSCCLNDSQ